MRIPALITALCFSAIAHADEHGTLIFEDDFERSESQEVKDEPGKGWKTNSKSRAGGNKQVDLKDGTMRIFIHETADHGVSVTHDAEFKDGAVGLRFMLEDKADSIGLNFADLKFKEVHAGHLFAARISTREVKLEDLKTGKMKSEHREMRKAGKSTPELKELLKTKEQKFPNKLEVGKWYDLLVTISGDTLTASIDGEQSRPANRVARLFGPAVISK